MWRYSLCYLVYALITNVTALGSWEKQKSLPIVSKIYMEVDVFMHSLKLLTFAFIIDKWLIYFFAIYAKQNIMLCTKVLLLLKTCSLQKGTCCKKNNDILWQTKQKFFFFKLLNAYEITYWKKVLWNNLVSFHWEKFCKLLKYKFHSQISFLCMSGICIMRKLVR